MPPQDRYVDFCKELLAPLGRIDSRYLFGGWCLYCNGVVFALVADGALYLKGDAENIPDFNSRGLQAFRPFPGKPETMKYFQAPPEIFEDAAALKLWCGGAIDAGLRGQKSKPRKAKSPQ